MAYLHDRTRVLTNPGLRSGVRDDVAAVSGIVQHWKQQQLRGKLRKYIVRRYDLLFNEMRIFSSIIGLLFYLYIFYPVGILQLQVVY